MARRPDAPSGGVPAREWVYRQDGYGTLDGVHTHEGRLVWYRESRDRHGPVGAVCQSFSDFLASGPPVSDVPPDLERNLRALLLPHVGSVPRRAPLEPPGESELPTLPEAPTPEASTPEVAATPPAGGWNRTVITRPERSTVGPGASPHPNRVLPCGSCGSEATRIVHFHDASGTAWTCTTLEVECAHCGSFTCESVDD